MLDFLMGIETIVFVIAGIIFGIPIALSNYIYDMDTVLTKKKEFFRCVFQWQFAILELEYFVKPAGIIILIVAVTVFVFPLNATVFVILNMLEVLRGITWAFMKVFGKPKEDQ